MAPTSTASRRAYVAKESGGFVYYVSITGITGAKLNDMAGVRDNVAKIRKHTKTPVAVGFGVVGGEGLGRLQVVAQLDAQDGDEPQAGVAQLALHGVEPVLLTRRCVPRAGGPAALRGGRCPAG
mgnify:CR=1 FL=1